MVDLKYIFSEDELKRKLTPMKGVCVFVPTEDGGFVVVCDQDVRKVYEQIRLLKQLNEKEKVLRLKL